MCLQSKKMYVYIIKQNQLSSSKDEAVNIIQQCHVA